MSEKINQDCYQLNNLLAYDWQHLKTLDAQHVKQTLAAAHKFQEDCLADPKGGMEALQKEWKLMKAGMTKAVHDSGILPELSLSITPVGPVGPGSGGRGPGGRGPGDNGPGGNGNDGKGGGDDDGKGKGGGDDDGKGDRKPEGPRFPKTPAYEEGDRVTISNEDEYRAVGETVGVTAALYLTWQLAKWGAAIVAAPETGGVSLGVAAGTP